MRNIILTCLLLSIPCYAETIIVDQNGAGDFTNIQDAINYSWHGDTIIVRHGTYVENIHFNSRAVTVTSTNPNDPDTIAATIISPASGYGVNFDFAEGSNSVLTGFTITGGGIYCLSSSPTITKNIIRYCSVDGILGDAASPTITFCTISNNGGRGVKGCSGIISENTITHNSKSGLYTCYSGVISYNYVAENEADGGLYRCGSSGGEISNNIIVYNKGGGLRSCGGTIRSNEIANNTSGGLNDCDGNIVGNMIAHNTASSGGGLSECNGDIRDNIISFNLASSYGGGLFRCFSGKIENNIISNNMVYNSSNTSEVSGGGIYGADILRNNLMVGNTVFSSKGTATGGAYAGVTATITNNTIVGNRVSGFISGRGGALLLGTGGLVKNNIIAFNIASHEGGGIYGVSTSKYNAYWGNSTNFGGGAHAGVGDIYVDPRFATNGYWTDPCGTPSNVTDDVWLDGDYHLKSEAGRWEPNSEQWVIDTVTSHCVDAGDPCDSIGYEPNPNGGRINIGAYGGTWEASKSTGDTGPEPPPRCLEYPTMDFNKDCKVDFQDFAIFTQSWLECNLDPPSACWN